MSEKGKALAPARIYPLDNELGSATSTAKFYHKKPLKIQMQTLQLRVHKVCYLPGHNFEPLSQQM
jgi:hypothetical protein